MISASHEVFVIWSAACCNTVHTTIALYKMKYIKIIHQLLDIDIVSLHGNIIMVNVPEQPSVSEVNVLLLQITPIWCCWPSNRPGESTTSCSHSYRSSGCLTDHVRVALSYSDLCITRSSFHLQLFDYIITNSWCDNMLPMKMLFQYTSNLCSKD